MLCRKCEPGFTWSESIAAGRAVAAQLSITFGCEDLIEEFQSEYKCHHNTETALLRVHNDILKAVDDSMSVILLFFNFSAKFDHKIAIVLTRGTLPPTLR